MTPYKRAYSPQLGDSGQMSFQPSFLSFKHTHTHNTQDYLTPGEDGFYYEIRDYNLNETDLLGSGGFGSCLCAQDLTTEYMFAIKLNKIESYKSILDECRILSHLSESDHIIKFLGAVIDEGELPTQPPLVCKMMMELAESKNMAIKV